MDRRLPSALDHVAVAVPDADVAERRWRQELGGGLVAHGDAPAFHSRQLRFTGGGKLELISPPPGGGGFVEAFLERFGTGIHHVTLRVPDLGRAIETLEAGGLDVVDVDRSFEAWQEGFLRPSQVGGLVVQIAQSGQTDEEWAASVGVTPEPPRADAPRLLGPRLRHPDLDRAAALWTLLGATVEPHADDLRCTWADSPLDVRIERGEPAGGLGLRFEDAPELPDDPQLGPGTA
jgi:catechol 2,3-dioxygenase-like lactoylglutathione lyase family enzyme